MSEKAIVEKKFKKGEVISSRDSFELWMYDLQCGKVGYYYDYGLPSQLLISVIEAPSFLGELGFFEAMPRYGTTVALEDCTMNVITHGNLTEYFASRPGKIMQILEQMSHKTRDLTMQYVEACTTIHEYLESEERSEGLIERMKKFASAGKRFRKSH